MGKRKYKVYIDRTVVAENMDMHTALILVEALFEKYCNESCMTVSIKEIERNEVCENAEQ